MVRGLRLVLEGARRGDRRVRFARASLSPAEREDWTQLVTDARGRLRYRLPPGDYRLRLDEAPEHRFEVRDGWATIRVRLP